MRRPKRMETSKELVIPIIDGLIDTINGEGSDTMVEDLSIDDANTTITVLLADLPQQRLSELVAEVLDRIRHWRVDPFRQIEYTAGRTIKFHLRDMDDLLRIYNSRI